MGTRFSFRVCAAVPLLALMASCASAPRQAAGPAADDAVVEQFSRLAVASVSDAVDQTVGGRAYMSHGIRPLFPTKLCGRAVTVLARPSDDPQPPSMALEAIDESPPGKVLVIVMEGEEGADVAAFGGIMANGAQVRGFEGAVLDGGCRDVLEITEMGFPVFARSVSPGNSVGRYINVSKNEPVVCGGVEVREGDIVIGDMDGVAVVPREHEAEILRRAQDLERREAATTRDVRRLKSIREASQRNQRI